MRTLATLIAEHGVDVHDHLDRDDIVPVHDALQFQGDVAVIPTLEPAQVDAVQVPAEGSPWSAVRRAATRTCCSRPAPSAGRRSTGSAWTSASSPSLTAQSVTSPTRARLLGYRPGPVRAAPAAEQADEIRMVAD